MKKTGASCECHFTYSHFVQQCHFLEELYCRLSLTEKVMRMSIDAKEVVRMVKLKPLVQTTRGSMTVQRVRVVLLFQCRSENYNNIIMDLDAQDVLLFLVLMVKSA